MIDMARSSNNNGLHSEQFTGDFWELPIRSAGMTFAASYAKITSNEQKFVTVLQGYYCAPSSESFCFHRFEGRLMYLNSRRT